MSDRKYVVIDLSNTDKVLFSQVNQSSAQSVRRNLANTQCLLSYRVEPSFISDGTLPIVGSVMTQTEALTMLAGSDWSEPLPEE
jgi:predicted amidohydrolase|tara:strand:- start:279 stop:530 length:252 start_codon:yes stop_codon:yes gene_type:complete